MVDSSNERVKKVDFPFNYVGVYHFGPLEFKYMRKTLKKWFCVFICLTTKALQLKMIFSLATEPYVSAFTQFIARRGHPLTFCSDNGTNFVGANNELKHFASWWRNEDFQENLHPKQIVWKFNFAETSHF